MKLLIISSVFPPEPIVSARTSSDLAQELASQGNNVQVITAFPNRPAGRLYEGYQRMLWSYERPTNPYKVLRLFSFFSSQSNMLSRFLENISFGITSALAVSFMEKPDVIYANTWPIISQGILMLICKLRRIPLVLSVQDLYPESLFVQRRGVEKTSNLYKVLRWLDALIAQHCAGLIVISEHFKDVYVHARQVSLNKIKVIPNWIEDTPLLTTDAGDGIRKEHNIPTDAFLVVYGGNIGVAAGVENLIDTFQYLQSQENIYLLLAGAGSCLPDCLRLMQHYDLKRVKVHSPWHASDTYAVLSAADLCILPTQGEQSLVSIPSKLLSYMMAERCVLALANPESETAKVVSESHAGWVNSSLASEDLANLICAISRLPFDERNRRGQSGRRFVLKHFSKSVILPKLVEVLVRQ